MEPVFEAAESGDAGALASLLDADPAGRDARKPPFGWTPLHIAAAGGHVDAVDLLLARGADVDARETGDHTYAMHWAAASGHLDVVRRLADAGGDVVGDDDDHALGVIGWATCWEPCHEAVADFLVERGARHHIFSAIAVGRADDVRSIIAADPGALNRRLTRNENHQQPLHFAVARRRSDMVTLLIDLGADPLAVDGFGHLAAAYATVPNVDLAAMQALHTFTRAELVSATRGGRPPRGTPIDVLAALAIGDRESAKQLVGAIGPGSLHVMAKRGNGDGVAWLLAHGADPNALWNHMGAEVTALHLVALEGHEDVARQLLTAGADPRIRDSAHSSDALGWARYFKRPALIALLEQAVLPEREESVNVVLEFRERDAHLGEILEAFEDSWVAGISITSGLVRLDLETPGTTWGAAVTLVEGRLERLPFDWRSHVVCRRP